MAFIEVPYKRVVVAVDAELERRETNRQKELKLRVDKLLQEKKWSWLSWAKVPRYSSYEQALNAFKTDASDFFGNRYYWIMGGDRDTVVVLKQLKKMAQCASDSGVITLSEKECKLISQHM